MSGPDPRGAGRDRVHAALDLAAGELAERTAPEPEFEHALRARLVAMASVRAPRPAGGRAARVQQTLGDAVRSGRVRRRAGRLLAGLAVVALLAVGLTVGTSRSLPGSPLYGTKRAVEALQLRTEGGRLDEGIARLHLAETRLREVRALAAGRHLLSAGPTGPGPVLLAGGLAAPDADRLRATLAAMDDQTRAGSRLVEQVARTSGSGAPLSVLQAWAGMQSGHLAQLTPDLPAAARAQAQASLQVLQDLTASATALLAPGCLAPGADCPGTAPR